MDRTLARIGWRVPAVLAVVALMYPLGRLAIHFAPPGSQVSAYWPNAGLAVIAVVLSSGWWRWAAVAGAATAGTLANLVGGRPWDVSLSFGTLVALEGYLVYRLLVSDGRPWPQLMSMRDFGRLLLAAAAGSAFVGVGAGVTVATLNDGVFLDTARAAAASHAAALLIIVPLVMRTSTRNGEAPWWEAGVQSGCLIAVTAWVFGPGGSLPLAYLPLPFLVWGAARLAPRLVSAQLLLAGGVASVLTTQGYGPFSAAVLGTDRPPELIGTLLQSFLLASALVALPMALGRSQRHAAAAELQSSHDALDDILESITGTGIFGFTSDARIEFMNTGAELLTGVAGADAVGRRMVAVQDPRGGAAPLRTIAAGPPACDLDETRAQVALQPSVLEFDFLRADGQIRRLSVTVSLRRGQAGPAAGFLAVAVDVTERHAQEAALAAALATERESVERLRQIDETKKEFLATVSHELRTPITSILGYSQLLQADDSGALPSMHQQILGRIERNSRRLLTLIEDMLLMSRIERGELRLQRIPVDLREVIGQAATAAGPAAAMADVSLHVDIGERAVPVLGDADRLERACGNLISNGVKFSHSGDTVTVALGVECDEAVVRVTDTGVGISEDDQRQLFERFFRGSDAQVRALQGSGLGLSIAGAIVGGHGGTIDVRSAPGQGSTFTIRLPLLTDAPAPDPVLSLAEQRTPAAQVG